MSVLDLLKAADPPFFRALAAEDREALAGRMVRRRHEAREVLFQRGDAAEDLIVVVSGRLKVSVGTADGREFAFRAAERGETIGEIAVLDGGTRTADVTAAEPSEVLAVSRAAFLDLLDRRPGFARAVMAELCRRLRETSDQLESIALHRIETRLARFFLALARDRAPKPDGRVEFSFLMPQGELALLLGASRPKVNGAIALLEADGAIVRKGSRLSVDPAALARLAGGEAE